MPRIASRMRQAGRALARRPLYAAVAVVTVAAGIAASTAGFVLVDAALLSPLPFAEPTRLVTPNVISDKGFEISLSVPNYRDWSAAERVFESSGASAGWGAILTGRGPARVLATRVVYGDFFSTLGFVPLHGRLPGAAETARGTAPLVVLGNAFFRELGGDAALVGSTLNLDGAAYTIVGVLPPGVGYPSAETPAYTSLGALADLPWDDRSSSFGMRMIARLRDGADLAVAQGELDRISDIIRTSEGHDVARARLVTLGQLLVGDLERPIALLFAAAALVVLLACANAINLFLARGETRRAELAVRAALGAPRGDLIRLQLAESLWLAGGGAALGLAGAAALVAGMAGRLTDEVPRFVAERLELGPAALAFALALAAAIALSLAVVSALVLPRQRAADALHGTRIGSSHRATRFRSALVVSELALGTMLVAGAALLATSLERLRAVDKGFDPAGVVSGRLAVSDDKVKGWFIAFRRELLRRAAALPGVQHASLSLLVPLSERSWEMALTPEGKPWDPHQGDSVLYNIVSTGHFETLGTPLMRGRGFVDADRDGAELVAIVDESLAERYWPGQNPLGKRITCETDGEAHSPQAKPVYRTIVGVVRNVRHYELQNPSRIQVYIPLEQTRGRYDSGLSLFLSVRTDGRVASLIALLPKLVAEIDPDVPISRVAPLSSNLDRALAQPRLLSRTAALLGALALLLAGVGVFALASFGVAQRRREIGVRQALGATPVAIVGDVLGQALRWSGWGVGIGLVGAVAAARLARSLLWGVSTLEPAAYTRSLTILVATALVACAAPALRAARVDPARILRDDT